MYELKAQASDVILCIIVAFFLLWFVGPPSDRLLLAISSEVVNRESFIIGHLGLSQTEYVDNPSFTKHSQIMMVLRKWRQQHNGHCSVTKFLAYIKNADTEVIFPEDVKEIKRVVEGW